MSRAWRGGRDTEGAPAHQHAGAGRAHSHIAFEGLIGANQRAVNLLAHAQAVNVRELLLVVLHRKVGAQAAGRGWRQLSRSDNTRGDEGNLVSAQEDGCLTTAITTNLRVHLHRRIIRVRDVQLHRALCAQGKYVRGGGGWMGFL